jgi:hypothetical protein
MHRRVEKEEEKKEGQKNEGENCRVISLISVGLKVVFVVIQTFTFRYISQLNSDLLEISEYSTRGSVYNLLTSSTDAKRQEW